MTRDLNIITFAVLISLPLQAAALESVYSDLDVKKCKTIEVDKETGDTESQCSGLASYRLVVTDNDLRQSVTVVDPQGKQYHLNYYSTISAGFSVLGPKAEWRVEKREGKILPKALIVRVNASENSEDPNKKTSYLAVAKITPGEICVTDKIPPSPTMNVAARLAADSAVNRPCLK